MPAKKKQVSCGREPARQNFQKCVPHLLSDPPPPRPIFALLCTHQAWAVCRMLQTISKFVLWLPGASSTELPRKGTFWAGSCQTTSDFSLISTANCAEFDVSPCPAYLQCHCLPLRFLTCKSPCAHATSKCAHACEHETFSCQLLGACKQFQVVFACYAGLYKNRVLNRKKKQPQTSSLFYSLSFWSAWELLEPCRESLLIVLLVKRCLGNLVT